MKHPIILLCTIIVSTCSFAQKISTNDYEVKTTLADFNLKGKVEKVTSTATDAKGNTATLPFLENEFYNQISLEFNQKGLLTKRTNYLDYQGKLAVYNYVNYNYNNSNFIDKQTNIVINNGEDSKRIASDKTFVYDNKNRLINLTEKIEGKSSKSSYETIFNYSNKLDKITTKVEGSTISENNLTYNKNGLLVLDEMTSFDGKKGRKSYYIYNKETPIFQEEIAGNSSKIMFFENGNISKLQSFDTNKTLAYQADFDSKNEIVNFKKQSFRNGQTVLTSYQVSYEYDSKNNWINASISTNGDLKYVVKRTISYY
ncbi:hypothetical protein [Empedobacter falsenii]|uniref:YD repeat-containing protein n=1 Tax=Empedobacter falsenii TaxID=343874 RepID=A0AAW7DMP8_9FLAO|nr:hypothetical protein [Empedobacter falsenii]MDM1552412.1 hypothetical protein [Empedobacter falsenii]